MEPSGAAEEEHWIFRWILSLSRRQGKDRPQFCLLSCRFTSGITSSRTVSPEELAPPSLQNITQGDPALPGKKRSAEVVSCMLHFPCSVPPPARRGAHREVAQEVLGTSPQGQKPNPAQLAVGGGALASGHALLLAKQLHLGFHETN